MAGALGLVPPAVWGHIVYGRPSLLTLVGGAAIVAHVRVVDPRTLVEIPDAGKRRPAVEVEIREVLKGAEALGSDAEPGRRLRFASHGHGVAEYRRDEEALVFLVPIEASRELDSLRAAGIQWVSFQEHDARYVVEPPGRDRLLAAVRAYAVAGAAEPAQRLRRLRAITLELILSGDERLAVAAVQDAAVTEGLPLIASSDVPVLVERVVRSPSAPTSVRTALLAELERRRLVEGPPLWLELLRSTGKVDRLQVVRAAGRHPSPQVEAALTGLLVGEDPDLAEAAAVALASPAHAPAVEPLVGALSRPEPRVRRAAVRALGAIGSEQALAALAAAAGSHADPDVRRRAAAEVRKREP